MKTFIEFLIENMIFQHYIEWDNQARHMGLDTKKLTHPSGVGHHFVAMDKEGNHKGNFDPQKGYGKIFS